MSRDDLVCRCKTGKADAKTEDAEAGDEAATDENDAEGDQEETEMEEVGQTKEAEKRSESVTAAG
jgi:hypothetical protein